MPPLKDDLMINMTRIRWGILLVAIGWAVAASAASFDCNKAVTDIEKTICSNTDLSALDEEISQVYRSLDKGGRYYEAIVNSQRRWIRQDRQPYVFDFEDQRNFLEVASLLSNCLSEHKFNECTNQADQLSQKCMEDGNYSTASMRGCSSVYIRALRIVESYESNEWQRLHTSDPETLALFKTARGLWLEFIQADCDWMFSEHRQGTIASSVYQGCMLDHLNERVSTIFSSITWSK